MRLVCFILWLPLTAHADLYRWIDPVSGSVKLSSLPPSDPQIQAEVVRYNAPVPPKPPATDLESRWRALTSQLLALTPQDWNRASDALRQHLEAYEAVRAELDRQDPAGAARRREESTTLFERLKQGLAAQLAPKPPAQ